MLASEANGQGYEGLQQIWEEVKTGEWTGALAAASVLGRRDKRRRQIGRLSTQNTPRCGSTRSTSVTLSAPPEPGWPWSATFYACTFDSGTLQERRFNAAIKRVVGRNLSCPSMFVYDLPTTRPWLSRWSLYARTQRTRCESRFSLMLTIPTGSCCTSETYRCVADSVVTSSYALLTSMSTASDDA